MLRIRKILARERASLLAEFGAPDVRTLFVRAILWGCFATATISVLLGLVWLYYTFGLAAMWMAVLGIILLAIWMEGRTPVCEDADWLGSDPALPPPGMPQIGRASRALTPSRPGACRAPIEAG